MRVRGPAKRIKWKYTHKVPVNLKPEELEEKLKCKIRAL